MTQQDYPLVRFFRVVPEGVPPIRADWTSLGTVPAAAMQYCEALTSASAFGYYVFAPRRLYFRFDGTEIQWMHDEADDWCPVRNEVYPGLESYFDERAPEDIKGYEPPFVSRLPGPGLVQIWSGLFVRTAPGVSSLLRPPANVARSRNFDIFEGIVETDRWFGPLFINLRLTATDRIIELSPEVPLLQLQPLRREAYSAHTLKNFEVVDTLDGFTEAEWEGYRQAVVTPNKDPHRKPGIYSIGVRKRAADERREAAAGDGSD